MSKKTVFTKVCATVTCMVLCISGTGYADYMWNANLGRFVKTTTVVHETPEEQFAYAEECEEKGDIKNATLAYDHFYRMFPHSPYAEDALIALGRLHEKEHRYIQAFRYYQKIIDAYPHTENHDELVERQFRIGNIFLSGEKGKLLNVSILPSLPRAIEVFEKVIENAPFSEFGAKAHFNLAMCYKKSGKANEAIDSFRDFIDTYTTSELVPKAYFQIAEITFHKAIQKARDEKLIQESKDLLEQYIATYPVTLEAEAARKNILRLDERDAERIYTIAHYYEADSYLESAAVYYEEVIAYYPESLWAKKAAERLKAFEDPEKYLLESLATLKDTYDALVIKQEALYDRYKEGALDKKDFGAQKKALAKEVKEAKKQLRAMSKEKKRETDARWEAWRRKKRELEKREQTLVTKELRLRERPSADLETALVRWKSSLEAESYALEVERRELLSLEHSLGIRRLMSLPALISRPEKEIDNICTHKEKVMDKLSSEEKELWSKQEKYLYEQAILQQRLTSLEEQRALLEQPVSALTASKDDYAALEKLFTVEEEKCERLKSAVKEKKSELHGVGDFLPMLTRLPIRSVSGIKDMLIKSADDKCSDQLQELHAQLAAKEEELCEEKERHALYTTLITQNSNQDEAAGDVPQNKVEERKSQRIMRKKIMKLEKRMNAAHQAVDDALHEKERLVHELDSAIVDIRNRNDNILLRMTQASLSPVRGIYVCLRAFLVGMPNKEREVKHKADRISRRVHDAEEKKIIANYNDAIAAQDAIVREKTTEILALEIRLEEIVGESKDVVKEYARRDMTKKREEVMAAIEGKQKNIAVLTREIENIKAQMPVVTDEKSISGADDYAREEGATGGSDEGDDNALALLEAELLRQEAVVADIANKLRQGSGKKGFRKERVISRKTRKSLAKIQQEMENVREKEADIRKELTDVNGELLDLITKQRDVVQTKLDMIKKVIPRLEKYQDPQLSKANAVQKRLFEKLDVFNSQLHKLEIEPA